MKEFVYEGDENYIFVSYCHQDKDRVLPVIKRLSENGARIWYDRGIHPGSEWPEIVAGRLENCTVFMVFLSNNYIRSQNCIREIHFAVAKNKQLLSVMLEPVSLTPGVEMQLCVSQAVQCFDSASADSVCRELLSSAELGSCRDETVTRKRLSSRTPGIKPEALEIEDANSPGSVGAVNKKRQRTERKPKKGRHRLRNLAAAVVGAAAVLTGVMAAARLYDTVEIGGQQYSREKDSLVHISDREITSEDWQKLKKMKSVTALQFENRSLDAEDLEELGQYKELRILGFTACTGLTDLDFLNELPQLYSFTACDCNLQNDSIRPDGELDNLTDLEISGNPELTDISWIEKMPELYTLNLERNSIADAGNIMTMKNLTTLSLADNELTGLESASQTAFSSLRLTELNLSGNQITDFSALDDLTVLEIVDISGNGCRNAPEFFAKSAKTLRKVDVSDNSFTQSGCASMFGKCNALEEIRLDHNAELTDLSFLGANEKLEVLTAAGCRLTGLNGLEKCTQLRWIDVSDNSIESLQSMPELNTEKEITLVLNGNWLTDISGLPENVFYSSLLLYDNELQAEKLNEDIMRLRGRKIGFSWTEGADPAALDNFSECAVEGVPNDRKVSWEDTLGYKCSFERMEVPQY